MPAISVDFKHDLQQTNTANAYGDRERAREKIYV